MDDTDRQLISLLRAEARTPVIAPAKKLRVARATVQNRIAKLESDGTIVGYTVRLKPEVESHHIRAMMSQSRSRGTMGRRYAGHFAGIPNVSTLHTTNGRWDLIAELRADTLEAFDSVLTAIRSTQGISNTETSIMLSTHKL